VYRVVQESLTNIARHAGARNVTVKLDQTPDSVVLTIEDDGIGVAPEMLQQPSAHGIFGMRQRTAGFAGALTIEQGVNRKGTRVTAQLPLDRAIAAQSAPAQTAGRSLAM
jgi:signal transduction histidine kinase